MLNVLLSIDQTIVRDGIRMLLETDSTIRVSGDQRKVDDIIDFLKNNNAPDVILMDLHMEEVKLFRLFNDIKEININIKVVVLSSNDSLAHIARIFSRGISGYLLKSISANELIFALKHIAQNGRYLCTEFSARLLDTIAITNQFADSFTPITTEFSEREMEVLRLIGEGLTNAEMSEKLFISKRTIEGHRQNLIDKTGSKNTAMLIRYALVNRLIK